MSLLKVCDILSPCDIVLKVKEDEIKLKQTNRKLTKLLIFAVKFS